MSEVDAESLRTLSHIDDIKLAIKFKDCVMNIADNMEKANSEPKK